MTKPKEKRKVEIEKLQAITLRLDGLVDLMPLVGYVMKCCGCTYEEISQVYGIGRPLAKYHVDGIKEAMKR